MTPHTSSTRALLQLTWPVLIAQLAMMGNAVIDTAMAGHLSAIDLAAVGIAASIAVNALRGFKKSVVPMVIYAIMLWGVGLGGGILLGLHDTLGPARGAPGFWIAGIAGIWLAAALVAVYLNAVSRRKNN